MSPKGLQKILCQIEEVLAGKIQTAAVVGAGTMGRGIAMCFANSGIPVLLKESVQPAVDTAMKAISASYQSAVQKGKISAEEMRIRFASIRPQMNYSGFTAADIVVEAVFENLEVKRSVFAELTGVVKSDAILATNTSYLNIDEIAEACAYPQKVIGLHFFSPAHVMRLVEVISGKSTEKSVREAVMDLAKRLGKVAVLAGNCPGFIGNRMLRVYRREAQLLLEEGATPRQVDTALEHWGMAMGPFASQDLAGLDIAISSRHVFAPIEQRGIRQPRVMDLLYARGRLGQKTGAGWYRYDEKRTRQEDPEVTAIIEQAARESGTAPRKISSEEIVERTIYALINEGARVLGEGCAQCSSDIDLVYVNGYGFPASRGGPMRFADQVGLPVVEQRILEFNWEPAPLLSRLAASKVGFGDWDAALISSR